MVLCSAAVFCNANAPNLLLLEQRGGMSQDEGVRSDPEEAFLEFPASLSH